MSTSGERMQQRVSGVLLLAVSIAAAGCGGAGGQDDGDSGNPECDALFEQALASMVSSEDVAVEPECTGEACLEQLKSEEGWISFAPRNEKPAAGLVFYPGAGVDPRAYAPVLHGLARTGILVNLVPMPGDMALSGYDRAGEVVATHAEPVDWFLAGHSLGGVAVSAYLEKNPQAARGFIHWAAYGSADFDIHELDLPSASIYGTCDGQSTVEEVEDGAAFLPEGTRFEKLEGANHCQFGHLCQSEKDQKADISRETQHALTQAATAQFMHRVQSDDWSIHEGFEAAKAEADVWCQQAQRILFNPAGDDLPATGIVNQVHPDTTDFTRSSAGIDGGVVSVQTLVRQGANPGSLRGPAVIEGEIWCKMKSQEAVVEALDLSPAGAQGSCAEVNQAVLAWALDQVSEDERAAYHASGKTISFMPDADTDSGPNWILSSIQFAESAGSPGSYELTSTRLIVGDDPAAPESKRNVYCCKLWAPARALLWVLAQQ